MTYSESDRAYLAEHPFLPQTRADLGEMCADDHPLMDRDIHSRLPEDEWYALMCVSYALRKRRRKDDLG